MGTFTIIRRFQLSIRARVVCDRPTTPYYFFQKPPRNRVIETFVGISSSCFESFCEHIIKIRTNCRYTTNPTVKHNFFAICPRPTDPKSASQKHVSPDRKLKAPGRVPTSYLQQAAARALQQSTAFLVCNTTPKSRIDGAGFCFAMPYNKHKTGGGFPTTAPIAPTSRGPGPRVLLFRNCVLNLCTIAQGDTPPS